MLIEVLGGGAGFVAEVAGTVGWVVLPAVALFLIIRGLRRPALLVGVAALALAALTEVPPLADVALLSNGAMQLVATCAVLFLVFLPVMRHPWRGRLLTTAAAVIVAFEAVRVLSGQQDSVPTIAGALAGVVLALLLGLMFGFLGHPGRSGRPYGNGLTEGERQALRPAPESGSRPGSGRRAVRLITSGVALLAAVVALGFLITGLLTAVTRFDRDVVQWLASHRTDFLNSLATFAGSFGTTPGIVAVLLVSLPVILALTRKWAPAVFLLCAAAGETAIYLIAGLIVGRPRPTVDHLSEGLPPTSSFPSGHVAAAVVVYGGLALLLYYSGRSVLRWAGFFVAALVILGVAVSRLYWGVHYPTDVLVSLLFAPVWLAACWKYLVREPLSAPRTAVAT